MSIRSNRTDPAWSLFRDTIHRGEFARASDLLGENPALLHLVNGIGETVLHFLAVEDDLDGVAWLHARGADLNTRNAFGQPVIFEVAQLGYKDLFVWFRDQGVDLLATDAEGNDLLTYLLEYEQAEMADWVRRNGARQSDGAEGNG